MPLNEMKKKTLHIILWKMIPYKPVEITRPIIKETECATQMTHAVLKLLYFVSFVCKVSRIFQVGDMFLQ